MRSTEFISATGEAETWSVGSFEWSNCSCEASLVRGRESAPCAQFHPTHHRTSSLMSSPVCLPIVPLCSGGSVAQGRIAKQRTTTFARWKNKKATYSHLQLNIKMLGQYVLDTSLEQHYDPDSLCVERKPETTICTGFVMRGRRSCTSLLVVCWVAEGEIGRRTSKCAHDRVPPFGAATNLVSGRERIIFDMKNQEIASNNLLSVQ